MDSQSIYSSNQDTLPDIIDTYDVKTFDTSSLKLSYNIDNSCAILHKKYQPKERIVGISHILDNNDEYVTTSIQYKKSWDPNIVTKRVNIFDNLEFSFLIPSFEDKTQLYNNIVIKFEYARILNKKRSNKRKSNKQYIDKDNEIYLNVGEIADYHYIINDDDNYFRMRLVKYNDNFKSSPKLIPQIIRPVHYEYGVDSYHAFDCNSVYMHLSKEKMHKILHEDIISINESDASNKKKRIDKFISDLFELTMMVYYINTSYGWTWDELTADSFWNLSMWIISITKPFDKDNDWIKFVKFEYIKRFLLYRLYKQSGAGIKSFFAKIAIKSEWRPNKNLYPKNTDIKSKRKFREEINTLKKDISSDEQNTNTQLSDKEQRNIDIINDYNKMISDNINKKVILYRLSKEYNLSIRSLYVIINGINNIHNN